MAGTALPIRLMIVSGGAVPEPGPGEVQVNAWAEGGHRNLAARVRAGGLDAVPCGAAPLTTVVVVSGPAGPTLDDMLAATFASLLVSGDAIPEGAELLAKYAELARQGLHPGRAPLEESLEGVFLAIRHSAGRDLTGAGAEQRFVSDWGRMARVLLSAAEAGMDPFATPLFLESAGFAEELAFLRRDCDVYRQDIANSRRVLVRLPTAAGEVPGLIARMPRSMLFKDWARRDPGSPNGGGYVFLAVKMSDTEWVFSTDPAHRIPLEGLAQELQAAEEAVRALESQPGDWFDGAPYSYTLVASPRGGTRLSDAQVLRLMRRWAHARPVRSGVGWRRRLAASLGVAALLALAAGLYGGRLLTGRSTQTAVARGRVPPSEVQRVVRPEGARAPSHALIVVVSRPQRGSEGDLPALPGALTTAGRLYALLRDHYGYDPAHLHVLADDVVREPDGRSVPVEGAPDHKGLIECLNALVAETNYADGSYTNFLFFYGGHGEIRQYARRIGFLVLAGYDPAHPEDTGFDMGTLSQTIQERVRCSHQMLLMDCCYSGNVQARGRSTPDPETIYSLWRKKTHVVITAGTSDQQAWDVNDEPLFTGAVLEALTPNPGDRLAPADRNRDGIVTDDELYAYLGPRVAERARAVGRVLTPQHMLGLKEVPQDEVGQFLFVPQVRGSEASPED